MKKASDNELRRPVQLQRRHELLFVPSFLFKFGEILHLDCSISLHVLNTESPTQSTIIHAPHPQKRERQKEGKRKKKRKSIPLLFQFTSTELKMV